MISMSTKAYEMLRKHGSDDGFVRITVKTGGCAGMTYDATIVSQKRSDEEIVYEREGITVITDNESRPYLKGLHIDYSDDLISAGFRFNNSSNESSCGCGSSFSVSDFPQFIKGGISCGS